MDTKFVDFKDTTVYVGIDVHKKQWTVTVLTDQVHHRTFSQPPEPLALKCYLDKHFPEANVTCAYEAGTFGYWIHRSLSEYGYQCMVVNPADIPTTSKESDTKATLGSSDLMSGFK